MKKQVVFIHSAGAQGTHQGSSDLIAYLRETLGEDYHLISPSMPDPESPEYVKWKKRIDQEFKVLDDEAILIGHSLGGSVLLKYLSEETYHQSISGLFLIATPYWGKEGWEAEEYTLAEGFPSKLQHISQLFFYHSQNDEIVSVEHVKYYAEKLPQATVRLSAGAEHVYKDGISELVNDIRSL